MQNVAATSKAVKIKTIVKYDISLIAAIDGIFKI